MEINEKIKELMSKKISRKRFLILFGTSILAVPFLSKKVLARVLLRKTNGNLLDIADLYEFDNVGADIIPDVDNTRDLGSTSKRFAEGRFNKVFGADGGGTLTLSNSGGLFGRAANTRTLSATAQGTFASGYAKDGDITAIQPGCFAQGYAKGGDIISGGANSFMGGNFAQGTAKVGYIKASGRGAFAQGYTNFNTSSILASGVAGFAQGSSSGAYYATSIKATGVGAFAQGYCGYTNIISSGLGSFAQGYGGPGGNIYATVKNSAQFGYGTNSQVGSLQVGTKMRLKGTAGAPTSNLHNGDIWVNGGYVYIRSNGVSCKVVNNPL